MSPETFALPEDNAAEPEVAIEVDTTEALIIGAEKLTAAATAAFDDMLAEFKKTLLEEPARKNDPIATLNLDSKMSIMAQAWANAVLAQAKGDTERANRLFENIESVFIDYKVMTKSAAFRASREFWDKVKTVLLETLAALAKFGLKEIAGRLSPGLSDWVSKRVG